MEMNNSRHDGNSRSLRVYGFSRRRRRGDKGGKTEVLFVFRGDTLRTLRLMPSGQVVTTEGVGP